MASALKPPPRRCGGCHGQGVVVGGGGGQGAHWTLDEQQRNRRMPTAMSRWLQGEPLVVPASGSQHLGLSEESLMCFIWCWGCFYRSLEMKVKDARWLSKSKQSGARRHRQDSSFQPFLVCTWRCPRHGVCGRGVLLLWLG